MKVKYRYYIVVDGVRREINPSGVQGLQTAFTQLIENRFAHTVEIITPIILTGDDFKYFYAIETSSNRCGDTYIEIDRLCDGEYSLFLTGLLRPVDGYYQPDTCRLEIQITAIDPYYCFDYNKKREIDIFEAKPYNERVQAQVTKGVIETVIKEYADNEPFDPYGTDFFGGQDPRILGWLIYRNESWIFGPNSPRGDGTQKNQFKTYYAREKLSLPSSDPDPGAGWIFISDNGTTKVYARQVVRANYRRLLPNNYDPDGDIAPTTIRHFTEMEEDSLLYAYDVMGLDGTPEYFDNGILLSDLLGYFINKFCGMPIRSEFFQINAAKTFATAYPQLPDDGRTTNNIVFQKSDVKRLNASNNATKGVTTLEKFIESVLNMYNLMYRIENGYFNIEHVSYWQRSVTLDLTQSTYAPYMNNTNKYKYDKTKLPQFEQFEFMEAGYPDFKGVPIEYFGRCISLDENDKIKPRKADIITTDVEHCMINSGGDNDKVSDDGFVIVATELSGDTYYIMRHSPILEPYARVNNPLSWAHLQEAFYQHARPQKIGLMNNTFHQFYTTAYVKKQDTVRVPFCCGDELVLSGLVRTEIGDGIIEKAVLNHFTDMLELDLLYDNPYQEAFCTPLTKFSVNRVASGRFYFDVDFLDCSIPHVIVVETIKPNGAVIVSNNINTTCGGIVEIPLDAAAGLYKFRARQVCAEGMSTWSDYVSVDYVDPATCAMLPTYAFVQRKTTSTFVFQFTASGFTDAVDGEVTIPSGAVSKKNNLTVTQLSGVVQIEWNIAGTDNPVRIFPGSYKFKFRRRCGSNTTGLYGTLINVTV